MHTLAEKNKYKITTRASVSLFVLAAVLFMCGTIPGRADVVDLTPYQKKMQNRITLNLKDAEVTTILRLLAEQNGLNMIISNQVSGTITMRLSNVALGDAMDEILNSAKAYIVEKNGIVHVYGLSEQPPGITGDKDLVTEIISPIFAKSSQLTALFSSFMSDKGKIQLYNDSRGNSTKPESIIITDYPENIETIKALVKKLDTETRQVLIQSKIIETSVSDSDLTGVEWTTGATLSGSPVEFDSKYAAGGKIKLGTLSLSDFGAVMQILSTSGKANVLSDVSLATMDGETANIHVGDQIPVGLNTIGSGGGGGVSFGTTGVDKYDVGVKMNISPRILNDNIIELDVTPEVSKVQDFTSLGGTNSSKAPIIKTRKATTKILLKSGETLVIGGLVQDDEVISNNKVPILGDLPVVGSMFRKKQVTKSKSDLLIFVTATVMEKRVDSGN